MSWRMFLVAAGAMVAGSAAFAVETRPPAERAAGGEEGVIDPKADQALHRMSDYLANLKSMTVETTTVDEKVTKDGQKVQELKESQIAVKRPGQIRVDRVMPSGKALFISDGKRFMLFHKDKNVFATASAPAKLDDAIDTARERLHVDAPGGDLFVSDPYRDLTEDVKTGHYIGLEPIDGKMAHHLFMIGKDVDWQIWIQDGPEAVPLRYVITSKEMTSQPQFTIEMRNWQANPSISEDRFNFKPPAGAKKVDFARPAQPGEKQ